MTSWSEKEGGGENKREEKKCERERGVGGGGVISLQCRMAGFTAAC